MTVLIIILCVLALGFVVPAPPGILYVLIDWYLGGGKEEYQREKRKGELMDEIKRKIKEEGKTLHDEIELARQGKSKYFKEVK